ncbi:DUF3750 domain-containing protein [Mangrovicella endophytica]|uniref:DUF3750 domain-containing protein n=1 Tax=Mangrovicella endophytica TaxID=2066697 RepID=UPI000C9E1072|nr:DUF3750 domain-containing protein [Mangrovicella endophytica]
MRALKLFLLAFALIYLLPAALAAVLWWVGSHPQSWHDADWASARLLPAATETGDAAVYILAARTGGLKGAISEHSWIVVKEKGARSYERWDKVGWGNPIRHNGYPADGRWYSNEPRVVLALTGTAAEALIPKVRQAIAQYPYAMRGGYTIFPGPNSNTFVAYVLRAVPGLDVALPPAAVGRDYPANGQLISVDEDRHDLRLSLFGYAGVTVGLKSGLEVNILGLVAGIDPMRLAVKVPAFGTYGLLT